MAGTQPDVAVNRLRGFRAGRDRREAGGNRRLALRADEVADRLLDGGAVDAGERRGGAKRDHVAAPLHVGRELGEREIDEPRAGGDDGLGRFACRGIGENDAGGIHGHFRRELADIVPVERDQHVEPVGLRVERLDADLDQGRRLATAHLRAGQLGHEPVIAGARGGLQERAARRDGASAAGAGETNGNR